MKKIIKNLILFIFCLSSAHLFAETEIFHSKYEPSACPKLSMLGKALVNARCGFLVVPENRTKANGSTIRLAVAIIPSKNRKSDNSPIVYLAGGPGGSAILDAPFVIHSGLNENHDVILLAQRGTFLSKPVLTCPEIDRFNQHAISLKYDADSTRRLHVAATQACYQRLSRQGYDLSAYNTTESAADLEDLRVALKLPKWNVYGYSYGTDLALNLIRQYPKGIRAAILDSVVPPDRANLSWTWGSVKEAFKNLFNACEADFQCRTHYPKLEKTFTKLVQKLEDSPQTVNIQFPAAHLPVKVMLDGGALVNWLVGAQRPLSDIPLKIQSLANGKPEKIASAIALLVDPKMVPEGIVSHGLTYSVICSEWVPYENVSAILEEGKKAFPDYPASVLAQAPQLVFLRDDCKVWKVNKAPIFIRQPINSNIPTLILSGSFDAKTSPGEGNHVARTLKKSIHIIFPGEGHRVAGTSPCAQNIVDTFLKKPNFPLDASCVSQIKPTFITKEKQGNLKTSRKS